MVECLHVPFQSKDKFTICISFSRNFVSPQGPSAIYNGIVDPFQNILGLSYRIQYRLLTNLDVANPNAPFEQARLKSRVAIIIGYILVPLRVINVVKAATTAMSACRLSYSHRRNPRANPGNNALGHLIFRYVLALCL
jgi:hypothetical protein